MRSLTGEEFANPPIWFGIGLGRMETPAGLRQRAYPPEGQVGLATSQVAPDKGGSATALLWRRLTKRQ